MNYWLLKTEPETFSWDELVKKGSTMWDGVRNYQARNNLRKMLVGELALFYHSVKNPAVIGIAKITKEHYSDPTAKQGDWSVVDVAPVQKLDNSIALSDIKSNPKLSNMVLVKNSRLSVQPVTKEEFDEVLKMASGS